jgi:hypothetical protein
MKISMWHKKMGDSVEWVDHFISYDMVYRSKVFTFTADDYWVVNTEEVIKGGTGYNIESKLPEEIDRMVPDYSLYPQFDEAYGFLTRGCPRNCGWCVVPHKEGKIREYMDIEEFIDGRTKAILMDNNVLAHGHGLHQIEKIGKMGIKIDFNQGLDARLIDESVAELLSSVRWLCPLRMSCDTFSQMADIEKAVELLRRFKVTPSAYFVYVLVKNIPDALVRVEFLRKLGCDPFAQPYRNMKDGKIMDAELVRFSRWVNHKAIFKSVRWEDYRG